MAQFEFVLKGRGFSRAVSTLESIAALAAAEKLRFWVAQRFSAAISRFLSVWALAPEVARVTFSATSLAAEGARFSNCTTTRRLLGLRPW